MSPRWLLLSVFLLAASFPARAQVDPDTTTRSDTLRVIDDVETAVDDLEAEVGDPTQLAEILTELAAHPLNVNTAPADDLALIPAFSGLLARRIVAYRTSHGPFASLDSLRKVNGVTARRLLQARPYLRTAGTPEASTPSTTYPSSPSLHSIRSNLEVDVMQRVERRLDLGRGYSPDTTRTTFVGSPIRLTTRLQVHYERRLRAELTLEKDPGEAFTWTPDQQTFGFDHVAGTLALRDFGRVRSLVIGDFSAAFGQGVSLWRSIAFGKGRSAVGSLARRGRGIVPFASTEENRFFRGAATTVHVTPSVTVSAFGSRRTLDATLGPPAADGMESGMLPAVTLSSSGLHRTPSEIARKDALRETVMGGAVEGSWTQVRIGGTMHWSQFDRPVRPGDQPYERFDFSGDALTTASVYATAFLDPYTLFGEVAWSSGTLGGIAGATMDLGRTEAILLGRVYPRSFVSLHGYAFGERNGTTQNEIGAYLGIRQQVAEDWHVAAYVDQYRFPWLRFSVPRPSNGIDARLVVEHTPRPWLEHYVQFRSETREAGTEATDSGGRRLEAIHPETRQSLRWHGSYAFSDALLLRTRLEATRFSMPSSTSTGMLLYQDVRWSPVEALQLDTRLAFFDTDDFDARVFAYEHDLLYAFSVPAFFGHGQRFYLLARYQPSRAITIEAKYGVTRFEDVTSVGSGLNETEGNRVRTLGVQVRWKIGP